METTKAAIVCLGKKFKSEEERREHFREELRTKLPDLKKIDGFPIGEDDDIIALSDPPYYTACPNPWLIEIAEQWEREKETLINRKANFQVDEPYASDISEGKNNPIYNAHSYHTKVPHPAIMRYLLHYTQPGDIVLDGFAGTGMTGVAARFCNNPDNQLRLTIEKEFKNNFGYLPIWGERRTICSDLSPIASFIASNYTTIKNAEIFEEVAEQILTDIEKNIGWMWRTSHRNGKSGEINFVIWSDVYLCSQCNSEIIYWDAALNHDKTVLYDVFNCPHCDAEHTKKTVEKAYKSIYDSFLKKTIQQVKSIPVEISYTYDGKRYTKVPDEDDLSLLRKIDEHQIEDWIPTYEVQKGDKLGDPLNKGFTHIHHFFTKRGLASLAKLNSKITGENSLKLLLTGPLVSVSKMYRWTPNYEGGGPMSGTIYFPSIYRVISCLDAIRRFAKKIPKVFWLLSNTNSKGNVVQNSSANDFSQLKDSSVDYIFTDPPFGANIMYSELSLLWESWLGVRTNNIKEAIENRTQKKSLSDYQDLMTSCFREYFRVLKPGKWMTVEFSNTSAAVWNGIQTALQIAGFVIANVSALDKKQGSFNAINSVTSVKQDLVISCYKPTEEFTRVFHDQVSNKSVWSFVSEHLQHLPIQIYSNKSSTTVIERNPKILYDRLISFYLTRGLPIPIDASDFQKGLKERFLERDGMYFTIDQAAQYETLREKNVSSNQLQFTFDIIYSETDAILWLKEKLGSKPATYQDIQPEFRKANVATRKGEKEIELQTVLEENFIEEPDGKWRMPDLNEIKDREILRTKSLMKEFERYINEFNSSKTKKLKEIRVEAVRIGFKARWDKKDFKTIVEVADKIPQNILLEDEQLLMYYDIAKDRI